MDIAIVGLVFLTCLVASLAAFHYINASDLQKLLKERIGGKSNPSRGSYLFLKEYISKGLSSLGRTNAPQDNADASKLRKQLQAAGYRTAKASILFSGVKVVLMASLPIVLFLSHPKWMSTTPTTTLMAYYILLASIGFYAPQIWLRKKIAGRQRKIAEGFPDALDLMVICVEAGLSLNSAIGRIGEEMKLVHKELSEEFHFLSLELRTGLSRQQALRNLSTRVGLDEIKSLVSVLIQTERFGTSVSNALSVLSTAMRQTRQHKAEEAAAKLPVKLLFPLLLFIFPSLFIVILGPAALKITRVLLPGMGPGGGN
jgi:tight adherence protein C